LAESAVSPLLSPLWVGAVACALGAAVGSFLNVVIYRVPRGLSIVRPGSRCPQCGTPIRPLANLPILSYLWLRGRCLACGAHISLRYPAVEALCALLFLALALTRPIDARLGVDAALGAALIAVAFIDHDHRIIPNAITLPGIPAGLLASALAPPPAWTDALAGLLVLGGMLWAVSAGYERLTGRIGLGMGDVKLMAMLGSFLGLQGGLGVLVLGSLIGLAQAGVLAARGRAGRLTQIPFGPALAIAALAQLCGLDPIGLWLGAR
jgi:leader peptidase (prepilin peptidase)/N-methyltransferase